MQLYAPVLLITLAIHSVAVIQSLLLHLRLSKKCHEILAILLLAALMLYAEKSVVSGPARVSLNTSATLTLFADLSV